MLCLTFSGLFLSTIFCEKQIKRIRKHRIELQLSLTRQTSLFVLDWCCRGLPGNRRVKRSYHLIQSHIYPTPAVCSTVDTLLELLSSCVTLPVNDSVYKTFLINIWYSQSLRTFIIDNTGQAVIRTSSFCSIVISHTTVLWSPALPAHQGLHWLIILS